MVLMKDDGAMQCHKFRTDGVMQCIFCTDRLMEYV